MLLESKAVHNLEQRGRLQNLEIQRVENENLFVVLKDIGDVIKCSINGEDFKDIRTSRHLAINRRCHAIL